MAAVFDLDPAAITNGVDGQLWGGGTVNGRVWTPQGTNYRPTYHATSDLGVPMLGYSEVKSSYLNSEELASGPSEWAFHVVVRPLSVDSGTNYYGFTVQFATVYGRMGLFSLDHDSASQMVSAKAMMDSDAFPGIVIPSFPFMTQVLLSFTSTGDVYKDGVLIGQTTPEGGVGEADSVSINKSWGDTDLFRVLVSDSATVDLHQDMNTLMSQYGIVPPPPTSVSWSAPADGGSPITGYVARFMIDGEVVEQELGPEALGVSVPEGATAVQVLAVNAAGFSTPVERVL